MMITIAERFRPFSTLAGTPCLLPGSKNVLQIYPAHVKIFNVSRSESQLQFEFPIAITGPVKDFTVMQDLEKGCIKVWGESKEGFFRYRIHANNTSEKAIFVLEKFTKPDMFKALPADYQQVDTVHTLPNIERLSFGVTKKPDWTLVNRRCELSEILPFWFRLGQWTPQVDDHTEGTASLFSSIEKALTLKESADLAVNFKNLYLAGFEGLFGCQLIDRHHQGFELPAVSIGSCCSPLLLVSKGAKFIKNMLISQPDSQHVEILPCLIPELHAGRLCNASLGELGWLDLEWSKKQARRMIFFSAKEQSLCFHFQKRLKSYRLRKENAKVSWIRNCGEANAFEADTIYYFDQFQH